MGSLLSNRICKNLELVKCITVIEMQNEFLIWNFECILW